MNLQLALLILGALGIVLVFGLHKYSDSIDRFRKKLKQQAQLKARHRRLKDERRGQNEPVLGAALERTDELDAPLFDFESDTQQPEVDSQHSLLSDEQAQVERIEPLSDQQSLKSEPMPQPPEQQHLEQPVQQQHSIAEPEPETSVKEPRITSLKPEPIGPFTSLRQIDYWIKLSPASPVSQGDIMAQLRSWKKIDFPVQLHALTQEAPHWVDLHDIDSEVMIVDVVASYQLLDSGRATNIEDLSNFDLQVTALGQHLNAEKLMMASPEQALGQSTRLHEFYEQSHGPLEVAVCAPEGQAFMGKLVETSAKQQGLDFLNGEYVRLKRMANDSIILYRMQNSDNHGFVQDMSASGMIHSVRFSMVPSLSPTPGRDAKEMLDAVKAFASRVKGDIRIPGRNEFHQEQLLNLRNRVSKLEQEMIDAGLEPGSQEIQRIFC